MVGIRNGARTSIHAMRNPKKKVVEGETNMHGIHVIGMSSGESADGQAGGALTGKSLLTKEHILARKSVKIPPPLRKLTLEIDAVTGEVSSNETSEEDNLPSPQYSEEKFPT